MARIKNHDQAAIIVRAISEASTAMNQAADDDQYTNASARFEALCAEHDRILAVEEWKARK